MTKRKKKTVAELRVDLATLKVDDATRTMFEGMLDELVETQECLATIRRQFEAHEHTCGQYPCVCRRCP